MLPLSDTSSHAGAVNRAYPREYEGSYAQLRITASMRGVRLWCVPARGHAFPLVRVGFDGRRLNIIVCC